MKIILLLIITLAVIWVPAVLKLYSWKEGLILTLSLSIASYLIDRLILDKKKRRSGK